MKVSKEIYEFSEQIQDNFNPERIKEKEVKKLEQKDQELQEKIEEQNQNKEKLNYEKWDLIEQQIANQEQLEQTKDKDFSQEQMAKAMGCSQDHSKEIDIYNKSNEEKIERINSMKTEGNNAYIAKDFQKAAYYYQQALLIFHYLIPEDEKEETKCEEIKKACHVNLGYCYWRLNRYQEGLQETNLALQIRENDPKALLRRGDIYLSLDEFEKAKDDAYKACEKLTDTREAENLLYRIEVKEKKYKAQSIEVENQMSQAIVENKNENPQKSQPKQQNTAKKEESKKLKEIQENLAESMKTMEELKQKIGNPKKDKDNSKSVEDRLTLIEKKIIKHKKKFEDVQMAIELFKNYGFQPRQFDELMEEMKISQGFKVQERPQNMTQQINLSSEFITGFESGIFLRGNPQQMDDYGCPKPDTNRQEFQQFQQMMQPIKMMGGMIKDQNVEQTISTIEVFVSNLSSLLAVFDGYEGGDFCSGLIFGSTGATMLTQIATTAFQLFMQGGEHGKQGGQANLPFGGSQFKGFPQ